MLQSIPRAESSDVKFMRYGAKATQHILASEDADAADEYVGGGSKSYSPSPQSTGYSGSNGNNRSYGSSPGSYGYGASAKIMPKTKVLYIIEKRDGSTIEFRERDSVTPREMIGISQFFTLVSLVANMNGFPMEVRWSEVINDLGIDRHWVPGQPITSYDPTGDTIHMLILES